MRPTKSQREAVEAFGSGQSFRLVAFAGAGKTTTLKLMAESTGKRVLYLAFNSSVAREGRARFPKNTTVLTLHGLAFRATVARREELRAKFAAREGQVLVRDLLEWLEIPEEVCGMPRYGVAVAVAGTLAAFLASAEGRPRLDMVPRTAVLSVEEREREAFAREVVGLAERAWELMRDPKSPFPLSHDGYVRLWAEEGAQGLGEFEAVLVDEAQDLNPALLAPLQGYARGGGQLVAVGDPHQAIYGWRGAVNAMDSLPGPALTLPESFRFGPEIADYAEYLLEMAGRGRPGIRGLGGPSQVVEGKGLPPRGAALVYRTNAGVLASAAELAGKGYGVEIVGGILQTASLVEAGVRLMEGQRVYHPELAYFRDYREFLRVADLDPQLKALKGLLERYGKRAREMVAMVAQAGQGRRVDYTVGTAHRAKGLEWDAVLLGDDFPPLEKTGEEEWNLRYVAATRARRWLDIRHWT